MAFKRRVMIVSVVLVTAIGAILIVAVLPKMVYREGIDPTDPPLVGSATATTIWFGLQERIPNPYQTPLPEKTPTPLDGVYVKIDPSWPQWWACRRCADYRPAGGIWRLRFDQGVMRVYYDVNGWTSLASYVVSGNRLTIFNDAVCPQEVGEYTWRLDDRWGLDDRRLILEVVNDPCSIQLRGQNLSDLEWNSCMPPNEMTGASDHWNKPLGCVDRLVAPATPSTAEASVTVVVHPGYARDFAKQPEVYADANSQENPAPMGISVTHSAESISYGLNRVLWGEGDWVQAATGLPFDSMGVQIYGDNTIGWARVLFDGEEVWRGDTSKIWSSRGRFGGYIEVSDFSPGVHTIRVESLGFDYHPVTIAYFGFSEKGGVSIP